MKIWVFSRQEPPPARYRVPGGRLLDTHRPRPGKQHRLQQPRPRNHPHRRLRPRPRRNRPLRVAPGRRLEARARQTSTQDLTPSRKAASQQNPLPKATERRPIPSPRRCARNPIQRHVAHSDQSTTGRRQTGKAPLNAFQGAHGSDDERMRLSCPGPVPIQCQPDEAGAARPRALRLLPRGPNMRSVARLPWNCSHGVFTASLPTPPQNPLLAFGCPDPRFPLVRFRYQGWQAVARHRRRNATSLPERRHSSRDLRFHHRKRR